jgi:hypothetical protein
VGTASPRASKPLRLPAICRFRPDFSPGFGRVWQWTFWTGPMADAAPVVPEPQRSEVNGHKSLPLTTHPDSQYRSTPLNFSADLFRKTMTTNNFRHWSAEKIASFSAAAARCPSLRAPFSIISHQHSSPAQVEREPKSQTHDQPRLTKPERRKNRQLERLDSLRPLLSSAVPHHQPPATSSSHWFLT